MQQAFVVKAVRQGAFNVPSEDEDGCFLPLASGSGGVRDGTIVD